MPDESREPFANPPFLVESVADNWRHLKEIHLNPDQVVEWKNGCFKYEHDSVCTCPCHQGANMMHIQPCCEECE